jgi:hypothetical protein
VTNAQGGRDQGNARMAALLPGGEPVEQLLRRAQFFTPGYLWRPYVVYRSRVQAPPREPGTGGRKWRKIGVPY